MKSRIRNLLLGLIPVLVVAAVVGILRWLLGPIPILQIRADLGTAAILVSGLASILLIVYLEGRRAALGRSQARVDAIQKSQAEAHRRFLRRLDHEMKNPLMAIRAALANLGLTQTEAERRRLTEDVQHQVERMRRLVADLRKLAELEDRPIELLPVDIPDLLNEVVEAARCNPIYAGRDLRLVVSQVPWQLPTIAGDRDLLALAFYNLMDNALKFTGPQNPVEVRATEDGRALIVEVADSGAGIAEEDLPQIFDELYRGSNARGVEGSGLGLALVQRIVIRHKGDVAIRSRPGQGTVLTVRLPLNAKEAPGHTKHEAA
jgi:two-component system, OmpR family, sensor kinase